MIDWSPAISNDFNIGSLGLAVDYNYHPNLVLRDFPIETDVSKAIDRVAKYLSAEDDSRQLSQQMAEVQLTSHNLTKDMAKVEKDADDDAKMQEELSKIAVEYVRKRDDFIMRQRSRKFNHTKTLDEPEPVEFVDTPEGLIKYRNYVFRYKLFIDNQRNLMQKERSELFNESNLIKNDHEKILTQDRYNQEDYNVILKKREEIVKIKKLANTPEGLYEKHLQIVEEKRKRIAAEAEKMVEIEKQIEINKVKNKEIQRQNKRAAKKLTAIREKLDKEFQEVETKKQILFQSVQKLNNETKELSEERTRLNGIKKMLENEKQKIIDDMAAINFYKESFRKEFAEIAMEKQRIRIAINQLMEKRKEIPKRRLEAGLTEKPVETLQPNPAILRQELIFLQRDYDVARAQLKMEQDAVEALKKAVYPKIERKTNVQGPVLFPELLKPKVINGIRVIKAQDMKTIHGHTISPAKKAGDSVVISFGKKKQVPEPDIAQNAEEQPENALKPEEVNELLQNDENQETSQIIENTQVDAPKSNDDNEKLQEQSIDQQKLEESHELSQKTEDESEETPKVMKSENQPEISQTLDN